MITSHLLVWQLALFLIQQQLKDPAKEQRKYMLKTQNTKNKNSRNTNASCSKLLFIFFAIN